LELARGLSRGVPVTDSDALLQLTDVTKVFSGRHKAFVALAGVSLTIGRETRLGVVGASGSGKSTLARIAVGLERPTNGWVTFNGADVTTLRAAVASSSSRKIHRPHSIRGDPYGRRCEGRPRSSSAQIGGRPTH
jgi:peptide/nickel transport system ATP-binding protein